jgi:hypothetical protein
MPSDINRRWLIFYSLVLVILAAILPAFPFKQLWGSPDLGTTPITVAAVLLPWPVSIITSIVNSVSAAIFTGDSFVELSAGIGNILMALFTVWLTKRLRRNLTIFLSQASRFVLTSGMVAIIIGVLVAFGIISVGLSPFGNLSSSAWQNILGILKTFNYLNLAVSIGVNIVASFILTWLFADMVQLTLYKSK